MSGLIIAIDGPSGAGKSTLSKALAKELDYINIDTGAMYRSVALLATRQGIALDDEAALRRLCQGLKIEFRQGEDAELVFANGEDVSQAIRSPEVSMQTSRVSACPAVRKALVRLQQELGAEGGVVLEGRDIGTEVFPRADVKFYLSATVEERGRRRYQELLDKGVDVDLGQTIAEVRDRDAADSSRRHAPLCRAADAIDIDSSGLEIAEVLKQMLSVVRRKMKE